MKTNDINTLIICSFRYALGRKTYVVQEIIDIIHRHYDDLNFSAKNLIVREIRKEIVCNNAGMTCDQRDWQLCHDWLLNKMRADYEAVTRGA